MVSAKKKKQPIIITDSGRVPQQLVTKTNCYLTLLLVIAIALLYGNSLKYPLVFDDLPFFVDANLWRLGSSLFHLDLRWFSYASFGWTYNLFGQDWFWYRLGNLVLHALTTVLLFMFFSRLLNVAGSQDTATQARWLAFFGALIFALHPVAVYGVAYLIQRSIIMATLFGIATLLCYMEGVTKDKARWFVLSVLFYFLAVFSKEHSIMIPGVAAALTLLLHRPSLALAKKLWLPFALYLVVGLLVVLRTKGLLGAAYEPRAAEILAQMSEYQSDMNTANAYPLSVITQGYLFFKYLLLWVIPYTDWMAIDIREPVATKLLSWPQLPGFIVFLIYPMLAIKLLLKRGRQGLLGFGLLFPWILYLTELSSVRIQEPFVLYRSYLWMSGLPLVLLAIPATDSRKSLTIVLPTICVIAASLAWGRLDTLSDNIKTWSDVTSKFQNEKLSGMERAYINRGFAYINLDRIQEAREDFVKALTLNPKEADAHLNIGVVNFHTKNFPAALQYFNTAIELKPDYVIARIKRSSLFLLTGQYADALKDCEHAVRLDTQEAEAYLNCSIAHSSMGNMQEALRYLDDILRINPRLVIAYISRSLINARLSRYDAALHDLDQASRVAPDDASIYYNRGIVHDTMGLNQEAMQDYSRAIELNPGYAEAYLNRAAGLLRMRRHDDALSDFNRAVQLSPQNPFFYLNRGAANFNLGKLQDALNDYDRALALYGETGQDADYSKTLLYRGLALNKMGKKYEAVKSFRRSCEAGNQEACHQLH